MSPEKENYYENSIPSFDDSSREVKKERLRKVYLLEQILELFDSETRAGQSTSYLDQNRSQAISRILEIERTLANDFLKRFWQRIGATPRKQITMEDMELLLAIREQIKISETARTRLLFLTSVDHLIGLILGILNPEKPDTT